MAGKILFDLTVKNGNGQLVNLDDDCFEFLIVGCVLFRPFTPPLPAGAQFFMTVLGKFKESKHPTLVQRNQVPEKHGGCCTHDLEVCLVVFIHRSNCAKGRK